jgi:hypothetical protein
MQKTGFYLKGNISFETAPGPESDELPMQPDQAGCIGDVVNAARADVTPESHLLPS